MITVTSSLCYSGMSQQALQSMSTNDCQLQKDRIDIWQFSLTALPANATNLLNDTETSRANRFHFQRHQRRFTVARAMMRAIIARYLNEQPAQLQFAYHPHGKPFINHTKNIEFNLNHSEDLGLLAIGQHFPLGVDLEFFSARPYDGIGAHLFSEPEMAELTRQPACLKASVFFHIWAQKEAFIKACGMGLSYPTKQFTVPILSPTDAEIVDSLHDNYWKIKSFMPEVACCAALCYNPKVTNIRRIIITPEHFL